MQRGSSYDYLNFPGIRIVVLVSGFSVGDTMTRMSGEEAEYVRVYHALTDDYMDGRISGDQYKRALAVLADPRVEADLGVKRTWSGSMDMEPDRMQVDDAQDGSGKEMDATGIGEGLTERDERRMRRLVRRLKETAAGS